MRRDSRIPGWMVALTTGLVSCSLYAATPAEDLEQAATLFEKGEYTQAREQLLGIKPDQLNDEQKQRRSELMQEVGTAINQSMRASQHLEDADKAFDANDRAKAEKLYKSVIENNYASASQKQRAKQGIALLAKQRELEEKLSTPSSKPATVEGTRKPATRPAQAAGARTERSRAEASRLIQAGDDAVGRGQYDVAEQRFQEALRIVPNHPEALKGLDLVRQHRAVEGQPNLIDEREQIRRARWERAERLYDQNVEQIRKLTNGGRYDEARQLLTATRGLIDSARADASPPERYRIRSDSLESLSRYVEAREKERGREQADEQRRRAMEEERRRVDSTIKERDQRVVQLMTQAVMLRRERQYDKAADVLREILTIDPTYDKARYMLEMFEDENLVARQAESRRNFENKFQEGIIETQRALAPDVLGVDRDIYAYPNSDEWKMISRRDATGAGGETPEDRIANQQLTKVLPEVNFPEGSTFEDVVKFLREQGKLSIDVNWNALSLVGIDRTATVSLTLQNAKIVTVLDLALENLGSAAGGVALGHDVVDGILRISTVEELNRKTFSRVYDVQDLLVEIRSYRGGNQMMGGGMMGGMGGGMMGGMGGGMMGGMGGGMMGGGMGGGGFGGGGFGGGGMGGGGMGGGGMGGGGGDDDDDSSEEDRKQRIQDLEDLIKRLIEPGTWEDNEGTGTTGAVGSLQIWNDRLIVRHTANVHKQLTDLFKQLRESKDLQVSIEARFITMTNNFLEEIGVDLDVVLNQGNAGFDSFRDPNTGARALDPVTGAAAMLPRQFGDVGFTPAIPGLGTALTQTALLQPYQNVALVPQGQPTQWYQRHTTPLPLLNNSVDLATPRATLVPGSASGYNSATPGFQMFGSFLDNIQIDFLMRATQLDVRSSSVEAPRLVVFNNRRAYITVGNVQSFIFQPGFLPVGGSGVGGNSAQGVNPTIATAFSGRSLEVQPTVSADRKYVTLQLTPNIQQSNQSSATSALGPLQLNRTDFTTIRTNALVPDGGTILLGGLKLAGENEVEAGVPMLSKIPILKRAFTNRSKVKDEQIVLVLVKPIIIIPQEQEDMAYPDLSTKANVNGG